MHQFCFKMQQSQKNLQTDLPTIIPTIYNSTVFEQKCNTYYYNEVLEHLNLLCDCW